MKKLTFTISVIFLSGISVFGQGNGNGNGLMDQDSLGYKYQREGEQVLDTDKPELNPPDVKVKVETGDIEFEKKDVTAETEYEPGNPRVPKPPKETWDQLYNNYLKLGYGRFITPVAELYLHNGRNAKTDAGLDFKHISSSRGQVEFAEFRRDFGSAYMNYYLDNHSMGAKVDVFNTNYFYYADTLVETRPNLQDSIRQTFTKIGVDAYLGRNYDPEVVNYELRARFMDYFDRFGNNELHAGARAKVGWGISEGFTANIDGDVLFTNSEFDTLPQQSRLFFDFYPSATYRNDKFKVTLGLQVNSFTDSISDFSTYPVIDLSYSVVPEKFTLYGGLKGKMYYRPMYDLVDENPYIALRGNILPRKERAHFFAGITGTFARFLSFDIRAYTRRVENFLVYQASFEGSRFDLVYDTLTAEQGISASVQANVYDKIRVGVRGEFRNFDLGDSTLYNFAVPNTRVDFWASYYFADKVRATTEVFVIGSRVMALDSSGAPIRRDALADVNLSVDYSFSKRFSIFLKLNNILSNQYYRWYRYLERPFDIRGGVTLSF